MVDIVKKTSEDYDKEIHRAVVLQSGTRNQVLIGVHRNMEELRKTLPQILSATSQVPIAHFACMVSLTLVEIDERLKQLEKQDGRADT